MHVGYWWESQKERDRSGDRILEKQDDVLWTGSIWLRIGTSGGLL
jgi:hypothetical protein